MAPQPTVSVIVPARNEECCLRNCLSSLQAQVGIDFEIVVVNDSSSDHTRKIAQSFAAVRVLDAPRLPTHWSGKNNALVAGAAAARGRWLLFTDADTTHLPGSLAGSVAEAKKRGAQLLSYSPKQEVRGFWEKAVMPVIFGELATAYRPALVSNPKFKAAAANGQYLLISRDAYDAVGGHAAVAESLLEDVALARAVKTSGRTIFFRYGGNAVRTRMYRSFGQLIEGWTKNLALLFPSPLRLAVLRLTEFVLIAANAAIAISSAVDGHERPAIVCGLLALGLIGLLLLRIRKAHFSWDANVVAVFGLPVFSFLLWRSQAAYRKGAVSWKGRAYRPGSRSGREKTEELTDSSPTLRPTSSEDHDGLLNPQS